MMIAQEAPAPNTLPPVWAGGASSSEHEAGRETDGSFQFVNRLCAQEEEEKQFGNLAQDDEPEAKIPKLYSGDNVEALLKKA